MQPLPEEPTNQPAHLIKKLSDENGLVRLRARLMLVHIGQESVPALLQALKSQDVNTRWETVKALSEFHDPQLFPALTSTLMDEDSSVRWAGAEGLIVQGRSSLRPLLESFIHNFDSPWFREGLHHILHVYKDRNLLNKEELALFEVLHKQNFPGFDLGWTSEAAWAAERALEILDREKD